MWFTSSPNDVTLTGNGFGFGAHRFSLLGLFTGLSRVGVHSFSGSVGGGCVPDASISLCSTSARSNTATAHFAFPACSSHSLPFLSCSGIGRRCTRYRRPFTSTIYDRGDTGSMQLPLTQGLFRSFGLRSISHGSADVQLQ